MEKSYSDLLCYEVLEARGTPYQLVSDRFDRFVKDVLPQMGKGEERSYLLYSQIWGLLTGCERSRHHQQALACGEVGDGPSGCRIHRNNPKIDWDDAQVVNKGTSPRPPRTDPSAVIDDGGIDEEGVTNAMRNVNVLLPDAVGTNSSEPESPLAKFSSYALPVHCDLQT